MKKFYGTCWPAKCLFAIPQKKGGQLTHLFFSLSLCSTLSLPICLAAHYHRRRMHYGHFAFAASCHSLIAATQRRRVPTPSSASWFFHPFISSIVFCEDQTGMFCSLAHSFGAFRSVRWNHLPTSQPVAYTRQPADRHTAFLQEVGTVSFIHHGTHLEWRKNRTKFRRPRQGTPLFGIPTRLFLCALAL